MSARGFALVVCLVGAWLVPLPAVAQETGVLVGQILDPLGAALPGARITVPGTALAAVSDLTGAFRLGRIPAGPATVEVSYLGFDTRTLEILVEPGETVRQEVTLSIAAEGQAITVTAEPILEGQAKALNQQRTAIAIKNIVSSDQVGQFPDPNAAEATQRIPGVSIQRDQGEGRYVLIRGTEARLNSMTVNGERIPSPEGDVRNVALDVIPADLLEAIEVTKALTPDMDGDAIGGTVDLITKVAPNETRFSLDLGAGYNDLTEDGNQRAGFFFGGRSRDKRLGFVLAASRLETDRGSENFEVSYDDGDLDSLEFRDYTLTRERTGVTAGFDFAASDVTRLFLRGIWNRFDDDELRRLTANGVGDGEIERQLRERFESQEILSLSAGGSRVIGNDLLLDFHAAYSRAEEDEPRNLGTSFQQEDVEFATGGLSANPTNEDLAAFVFDSVESEQNLTTERDLTGAFDLSLPVGEGASLVKLGAKYRTKDKDRDNTTIEYEADDDLLLADFVERGFDPGNFLDGRYRLGPTVAPGTARRLIGGPGVEGEANLEEEAADYDAAEDTFAAYAMAELRLSDRLTLVPGARYERTAIDYTGKSVRFDGDGDFAGIDPVTGDNSYGELLPMAHLIFRLDDASNLRAAVTRTLARPNYYDLVPYELILEEDGEIVRGNPDLDVTTSWNADLLYERYSTPLGLFSAGAFYKRLSDYIYVFRVDEERGGESFEATQPKNGEEARLWGFELAWQKQFRSLPAPWDGLGLYLNYTWVDSEAEFPDREGEKAALPGQSKNLGNVSLSYERTGFSGRLSLNYHGKYIDQVGESTSTDIYYDDHVQLDLSASQRLTSRLRLYVELVNLTDEPLRYYEGSPNRPIQEEYYSWWGAVGLKWSIF